MWTKRGFPKASLRGAHIPRRSSLTDSEEEYRLIPTDEIIPSPFNIRQWDPEFLDRLGDSIEKRGQRQPIEVRPIEGPVPFEIVTGEQRWQAIKRKGLPHTKAIVREADSLDVILAQWDENEDRHDLTDYSRALKLKQMLEALGCTQKELAERINRPGKKGEVYVSRHLSFLKLVGFLPEGILHSMTEFQARAFHQTADVRDWKEVAKWIEGEYRYHERVPTGVEIAEYSRRLRTRRILEEPIVDMPEQSESRDESAAKALPEANLKVTPRSKGNERMSPNQKSPSRHPRRHAAPEGFPEAETLVSPEETLSRLSSEAPSVNRRMAASTVMQIHGVTRTEAEKIVEEYVEENDVAEEKPGSAGYSCPFCGAWAPTDVLRRAYNRVREDYPEVAEFILDMMQQQETLVVS